MGGKCACVVAFWRPMRTGESGLLEDFPVSAEIVSRREKNGSLHGCYALWSAFAHPSPALELWISGV